jgi:FAD/FMN-containing dehydrogenase
MIDKRPALIARCADDERVGASYRGNDPRLAQIKRRYDPDNLLHVNQNIRPSTTQ